MRAAAALGIALLVALAGCSGGGADAGGAGGDPTGPPVVDVGQGKGGIAGVVANEAIAPIAGALVVLQPLNVSALSTGDGQFAFDGLEPGAYVVNATHADYKGAQTTVQVVLGDPTPARLTLAAVRNLSPNVVADTESLLVSSAFCGADQCNKVFSGNQETFRTHDLAYLEVDDQPTTIQVEVTWDATAPTAEQALLECRAYGDDPEGSTAATTYQATGAAPLTLRMPGTFLDEDSGMAVATNGLTCELSAANTATAPAGAMVQQQAELYVHYFYNFEPDAGWTFIADGEHPVPP